MNNINDIDHYDGILKQCTFYIQKLTVKKEDQKGYFDKLLSLNAIVDYKVTENQMDLNQKYLKIFQLDFRFKNTDISICFEQVHYYKRLFEKKRSLQCQTYTINDSMKKNKHLSLITEDNFVVEILTRKNYDFNKYKQVFTFSQMTKDVPIEFIIRKLLKKHPKNVFNIYDSQIDETFFKMLSRLPTEVKGILVDSCNIGNSFPKFIQQHLDTQKLLHIKIASDPIDNKGLKKLLSLNLPKLRFIYLFNLNSTPDIQNVIQKINTMTSLTTHFHLTITTIKSSIYNRRRISCKLRSYFKDPFIYLNECSKVQLKPTQPDRDQILLIKKDDMVIQRKLTPPALFDYLENMNIHIKK